MFAESLIAAGFLAPSGAISECPRWNSVPALFRFRSTAKPHLEFLPGSLLAAVPASPTALN